MRAPTVHGLAWATPPPRAAIWSPHLQGCTDSASLFAVSGRQLQPEELDAETEEDPSVSEAPGRRLAPLTRPPAFPGPVQSPAS